MSREVIIPEVIRGDIIKQKENKINNLNISLSQNIDKRNFDNRSFTTTNNTTINNYNSKKGLIWFLFSIIKLPFTIPYYIIKFIFTKFDLKNKFIIERLKIKTNKLRNKIINSKSSVYNLDEIY